MKIIPPIKQKKRKPPSALAILVAVFLNFVSLSLDFWDFPILLRFLNSSFILILLANFENLDLELRSSREFPILPRLEGVLLFVGYFILNLSLTGLFPDLPIISQILDLLFAGILVFITAWTYTSIDNNNKRFFSAYMSYR